MCRNSGCKQWKDIHSLSLFIKQLKFVFKSYYILYLYYSPICIQTLVPTTLRRCAFSFWFQSLELCDLSDYRFGGCFCSRCWCTDTTSRPERGQSYGGLEARGPTSSKGNTPIRWLKSGISVRVSTVCCRSYQWRTNFKTLFLYMQGRNFFFFKMPLGRHQISTSIKIHFTNLSLKLWVEVRFGHQCAGGWLIDGRG